MIQAQAADSCLRFTTGEICPKLNRNVYPNERPRGARGCRTRVCRERVQAHSYDVRGRGTHARRTSAWVPPTKVIFGPVGLQPIPGDIDWSLGYTVSHPNGC